MDELTPQELNKFLREFLITVRRNKTTSKTNTFTLVTLQSFSISVISAEKMYVENWKIYRRLYDWGYALISIHPVIQMSVKFSNFNMHFVS